MGREGLWLARAYTALLVGVATVSGCAHAPNATSLEAPAGPGDACILGRNSQTDALVRLPFDVVHGRVYVQATVNGDGPFTFAIDTGASGFGRADASLTRTLNLPVTGAAETSDGVSTATVTTVRIDTLNLGGLERTDLDVITRDYSSGAPSDAAISGIIGRDFFADGLLVIDFPNRTLSFSRSAMLSSDARGVLHYDRPFRVPVAIGDITLEGNLDTGAAVTLVLPQALYERVEAGPLEAAGQSRLTNTTIASGRAIVRGPVRVGGAVVSDVEARVSDRFPELLVGGQVLQNYLVAIDQRTQSVAICPPV